MYMYIHMYIYINMNKQCSFIIYEYAGVVSMDSEIESVYWDAIKGVGYTMAQITDKTLSIRRKILIKLLEDLPLIGIACQACFVYD
jgi:hypothetical protein